MVGRVDGFAGDMDGTKLGITLACTTGGSLCGKFRFERKDPTKAMDIQVQEQFNLGFYNFALGDKKHICFVDSMWGTGWNINS